MLSSPSSGKTFEIYSENTLFGEKIKTLFEDKEQTKGIFPRTKVSAVSNEDGVGLDALLADGLMSSTDKTKLNNTNIAYGTCATAAATAAKVITITGNTNWTLVAGSMITILFSATNTAESPTFNVNGTGEKNVFYGANQITTSSLSYAGYANRPMNFMYDGTQYRFIGWGADSNSDTKVTNVVQKTSTLKYNPSTQTLSVPNISLDGVDLGTTLGDIDSALDAILGV